MKTILTAAAVLTTLVTVSPPVQAGDFERTLRTIERLDNRVQRWNRDYQRDRNRDIPQWKKDELVGDCIREYGRQWTARCVEIIDRQAVGRAARRGYNMSPDRRTYR
jgi:hypothetical protein